MSQENVEVVQAALEAWQHDDFDAFLSVIHPNIEWHAVLQRLVEGPESPYRGYDGMRRFWRDYRTELAHMEVEAQELRDVGDDQVVLLARFRWRGLASGIQSESPLGMVITVRDGKFIHSIDYLSHQEALEAVGLAG
jgi:ketosteroid isomerase-like protein